jgi:hypothetical protein
MNDETIPDLSTADLANAELNCANLNTPDLGGADPSRTHLTASTSVVAPFYSKIGPRQQCLSLSWAHVSSRHVSL